MVEHYSSKIQNAIQRELFKATSSIKIAMAWFTNDLLFQPLLMKLEQGVNVEIILNDDEINRGGETSIDFTEYVNNGGILKWNRSNQLMHDKFCIIDGKVVIYGSYNWTLKAEYNNESISIAKDEKGTLNFYYNKFQELSHKYTQENPSTQISQKKNTPQHRNSIFDNEPFCNFSFINGYFKIYGEKDNAIIVAYKYSDSSRKESKISLLDYNTLQPLLPYEYDDVEFPYPEKGIIWLKMNGRWAIYNVKIKKFITHHVFTEVRAWKNI